MSRFRKKPVVIEAWQVPPALDARAEHIGQHGVLAVQLNMGAPDAKWRIANEKGEIDIETLEGTMRASNGDWIIRGVMGEIYPCKPDIFEATYEPVV